MRRAGLYRHYVVFQEKQSTVDEYGAEAFLWVDKFPVRAYIQYQSGSKTEVNYEPQNPQTIKINIRFREGISEKLRVKVQKTPTITDTYEILYMEPVDLYNELELTVKRLDG